MKKKSILTALLSLALTAGVCVTTSCEGLFVSSDGSGGITVKPITSENEPSGEGIVIAPDSSGGVTVKPNTGTSSSEENSSSSEENSSSTDSDSSSSGSSDNGNDEPTTPPVSKTPVAPPKKDITAPSYVDSQPPALYGVSANLSTVNVSTRRNVLKGSFNNKSCSNPHVGEDGENWVFTNFLIEMDEVCDGANGDLRQSVLTMDVKLQNASPRASITMYDEKGEASTEYWFDCSDASSAFRPYEKTLLGDGWVRLTVHLPEIFTEAALDNVSKVGFIFSNAFGDYVNDSIYYIDDMYFDSYTDVWKTPTVHNPDGYYDVNKTLRVKFVGNSFIEFSESAYWLQAIANDNNTLLEASYTWKPNGRMADQIELAFGKSGYSEGYMSKTEKPDVIFLQDIYDTQDAVLVGDFLTLLYEKSQSTEVKLYPADNEGTDSTTASEKFGIDLVNWRTAIHTLKKSHGFTTDNLNYRDGATHANELNGVVGATLAYMELYGKLPNFDSLWERVVAKKSDDNISVSKYLPGATDAERQASLKTILQLCAKQCGIAWAEPCNHAYETIVSTEPSCEEIGWQYEHCTLCGKQTQATAVPALGHSYSNGACTACGSEELQADKNDLADPAFVKSYAPKYGAVANVELQSAEHTALSKTALKITFSSNTSNDPYLGDNGDEWVWTLIDFDLRSIGGAMDLRSKKFHFDVKTDNASEISSVMLYYGDGTSVTTELAFFNDATKAETSSYSDGIRKSTMIGSPNWTSVDIYLPYLFSEAELTSVTDIVLVFSDAYAQDELLSTVYIDNATLGDVPADDTTAYTDTYNPSGYYSKELYIDVYIAGNDNVSLGGLAYWLETLFNLNSAYAHAGHIVQAGSKSIDMEKQYNYLFGNASGKFYPGTNLVSPKVMYVQGYYNASDSWMKKCLAGMKTYNDACDTFRTELKVLTAEDETTHGTFAAKKHGLEIADWRTLAQVLKLKKGFTSANLNRGGNISQPSALSGLGGAILMYMDIYGEIPDFTTLSELAFSSTNPEIKSLLPGTSDEEKKASLLTILQTAAELEGLTWETPCNHDYSDKYRFETTCKVSGLIDRTCKTCGFTYQVDEPPFGHTFVNGVCKTCGYKEGEPDEGDLADLTYISTTILANWNVHSALTMQSSVTSIMNQSSSALKAVFNNKGVDTYTGEDGGEWVWTVFKLDLTKIFNASSVKLGDKVMCFNIKAVNASPTSAITYLDANGNRPGEKPFNNQTNNASTGITVYQLPDGWVTVEVDFAKLFPNGNLDTVGVTEIYLICSNAFGDYVNDTVIYLDNVQLYTK